MLLASINISSATLAIANSIQGNSSWNTIGGSVAGAVSTGPCPHDYSGDFVTTVTPAAGYQFVSGPTDIQGRSYLRQ